MRFTVRRHHGATVVGVFGQLDTANTAYLSEVLIPFLRVRGGLVIDLEALQYCSVTGLEFFISFDRRCRKARCPWALVPGASLHGLLRLSGGILPVAESLDEAAHLLDAAGSRRPTLRIAT
ncbi:STAS domain-containing protein [Mycobacterium asiaticum]|uniref:STAS domain-containing protein n=1 Tax=Mycobacterium asiaticum TaxID=1790 RepID=A0A1A3KNX5_MYCAS|nr:STAS domain-containing protein [Mycobacterium asiaticum]OBJ86139.1 hypothetical protein A5640_11200 [Mycobacterium asiaticum]